MKPGQFFVSVLTLGNKHTVLLSFSSYLHFKEFLVVSSNDSYSMRILRYKILIVKSPSSLHILIEIAANNFC